MQNINDHKKAVSSLLSADMKSWSFNKDILKYCKTYYFQIKKWRKSYKISLKKIRNSKGRVNRTECFHFLCVCVLLFFFFLTLFFLPFYWDMIHKQLYKFKVYMIMLWFTWIMEWLPQQWTCTHRLKIKKKKKISLVMRPLRIYSANNIHI